jgi:tetratricopeptide (TPR) repeat protein
MDTRISAREWYERGRNLRKAKMYKQALEDLRQASDDPNYAGQAHTQIALCLRAMGHHEDAIAALRYALNSTSISPNEALHALYLLGQSLESLGRFPEAIEAYNTVRQEDAEFLDVEARIKRLCGVRQGFLTKDVGALCGNLLARFGKR